MKTYAIGALSTALIVACGSPSPTQPPSTEPSGSAGSSVKPEDLAGPWCFSHVIAGEEREDEGRNYIFNADGSLLYQNSLMNPVIESKGTFSIDGSEIKILPTMSYIKLTIESFDSDEMVLDGGFVTQYWVRGSCPAQ